MHGQTKHIWLRKICLICSWRFPLHKLSLQLSGHFSVLAKEHRFSLFYFSISKAVRHLDVLATASANTFLNMGQDQVKRFVLFDMYDKMLLVAGSLILREGLRCVPIGGFISVILAEILAVWRKPQVLSGEGITSGAWAGGYPQISGAYYPGYSSGDILGHMPRISADIPGACIRSKS